MQQIRISKIGYCDIEQGHMTFEKQRLLYESIHDISISDKRGTVDTNLTKLDHVTSMFYHS